MSQGDTRKHTTLSRVEQTLRQWRGTDAAAQDSAGQIAAQIDALYEEYIAGLPAQTQAILAGHKAQARRVA